MKKKHIIIFITITATLAALLFFVLTKIGVLFNDKKKNEEIIPTDKFTYTPVMYKICDTDNCNYLVGAMHLGDAHIKDLSDKVINAYKEMDAVAVEIDSDVNLDLSKYMYQDGTTALDYLSDALLEKIKDFEQKHMMFMFDQYKSYKLGMISELLTSIMYMELGYMTEGVDSYFMKQAKADHKELISIETLESQMAFFDAYSDELYTYLIENTIDNFDEGKELSKKLYAAYLEGNPEKLKEVLSDEDDLEELDKLDENLKLELEQYNDDLFTKRNIVMADAIEEFLAQNKNVFVTVGAAHVVADDGIIALLSNKGYDITLMND